MSIGDPPNLHPMTTNMGWSCDHPAVPIKLPPRVLKLTGYTGQPVWVVASNICAFDHSHGGDSKTCIYLVGGETYLAKETPEQILEMLK